LGSHFAFFCQGTVLDAIAEFHELQIWGCIADKRELVPAEPDPTAPHFLIRGTLIEQDIRSHVHQRLLLAYAEGLEKAADGVSWLNVGEGI
jgi:hypothetical protein